MTGEHQMKGTCVGRDCKDDLDTPTYHGRLLHRAAQDCESFEPFHHRISLEASSADPRQKEGSVLSSLHVVLDIEAS